MTYTVQRVPIAQIIAFIDTDLEYLRQEGHNFFFDISVVVGQFDKLVLERKGANLGNVLHLVFDSATELSFVDAQDFAQNFGLVQLITPQEALPNKLFLRLQLLLAVVYQQHL